MINNLRNIFIAVIAILSIACSSAKQAVLVPDVQVSKDSLKRADNIFIDALKNMSLGNVDLINCVLASSTFPKDLFFSASIKILSARFKESLETCKSGTKRACFGDEQAIVRIAVRAINMFLKLLIIPL